MLHDRGVDRSQSQTGIHLISSRLHLMLLHLLQRLMLHLLLLLRMLLRRKARQRSRLALVVKAFRLVEAMKRFVAAAIVR